MNSRRQGQQPRKCLALPGSTGHDVRRDRLLHGIVFNGMFCDRPHDALAFAISYDRISSQSINLIQDQNVLNSSNAPLPSAETDFELDYTAYITPWLTMTPDLQYILHPGGGIPDAQNPAEFEPNAVVGQMELTIVF